MKQIKYKSLKIISIVIIGLLLQSCFFDKWKEEKYKLEGSKEHSRSGYKPATKEYFIANQRIDIGIYSQTSDQKSYFWGTSDIQKGPYIMKLLIYNGNNLENKRIKLWDIRMKSNLGKFYNVEETFPKELIRRPTYAAAIKNKKYEVYWRYMPDQEFDFNFSKKEVIYVTLDIEVIKDGISKREEITLKLIPVIDKDLRFVLPGMPGADT